MTFSLCYRGWQRLGPVLHQGLPSFPASLARRTLRIFPAPPPFDNTNFPEKHRLPIYPRVPSIFSTAGVRPPKGTREVYRMMGEETVHNKLVLGQYGIVAVSGGALEHVHFELMRNRIGRMLKENKSFAIYRVDPPYKPVTSRGIGKRLGGGKGSISHYVTPVRAGRIICEVGGKVLWEEVQPWLQDTAERMPFHAMAVSKDLLDRLDAEEKRLEETNENPYTFEWLIRNNIFDCQRYTSTRDKKWFGKFIYRDRTLNKKWNIVRQTKYLHR